MQVLELTWWELVSLVGLSQSLYLLVYMLLRAGRIRNAGLAIACFSWLSLGFLIDFASRFLSQIEIYPFAQDLVWGGLPIFAVLLALQIAQVDRLPDRKYFWMLFLIPLMGGVSWVLGGLQTDCSFSSICRLEQRRLALEIVMVILGGLSLLALWGRRDLLEVMAAEKNVKSDRYWLILSLIIMNCMILALTLLRASDLIDISDFLLIRNILGGGLVYLASTSLFRIYPQTLKVGPKLASEFNDKERVLALNFENLLMLQKVYQEPGYSRSDMARELGTSESVVTKLVKAKFGKSLPQLLNEKRVGEACELLRQTDVSISEIAWQAGFNSLPSFNRVFKDIMGMSPSEYRDSNPRAESS